MEDSAKILLSKRWLDEEKKIIETALHKLKQYKTFIPNHLKNDIKEIFDLANRLKSDYESLQEKLETPPQVPSKTNSVFTQTE